jgi:GGDEF domain-containing protein
MALREDLRSARFLEGAGLSLNVSGSFGLATYPEDGNSVPTILRAADTMMYEAKITRDSVAVCGKGTVSMSAKSASDSGPRQAVPGLFLERDSLPRR